MAVCKKCDRCTTMYECYNEEDDERKFNGLMVLNIDDRQAYYRQNPLDLCPKCAEEFKEWFETYNVGYFMDKRKPSIEENKDDKEEVLA